MSGCFHAVELCGKHSLAVFGVGSILSLAGRLTFRTFGDGLLPQMAVNGIGVFTLLAVADMLEKRRRKRRNGPAVHVAEAEGQVERAGLATRPFRHVPVPEDAGSEAAVPAPCAELRPAAARPGDTDPAARAAADAAPRIASRAEPAAHAASGSPT